jgi:hypothetical protein
MTTQVPIACTLTPSTVAIRRAALLPGLWKRAQERHDTPDGYRLRFDSASDTLQAITTTMDAERQCCRFLQFQLTIEPDGGPIWLTLSGPPGTRDFLAALVAE